MIWAGRAAKKLLKSAKNAAKERKGKRPVPSFKVDAALENQAKEKEVVR